MGYQPLLFNGFVIGQSSGGGGSSPTIGGPITGGLAGSILFVNPNATISQDNANFSYNSTTHSLALTGTLSASNVSGSNTGDVTLGTANGLSLAGQVLSLGLSSTSTTGALSSTDWNTFNSKQPSFTSQSPNLFFASPNGSSGTPTFRSIVAADLPSLSGTYVTQSEVGVASGVASLDGSGKVPISQLPSAILEYQGGWNPSTNTPTLSDGTGTNGYVYYVTANFTGPIAGLTDPSMINFQIGDLTIYSSSVGKWQLTTPAAGVSSVNGLQGAVVLTQGDLIDSTSGADGITVTGGTNAVWGSGTSISQLAASASQNGYLTSGNFTTFNSKQSSLTFGSISTSTTGITVGSGSNSTVGPNVTINIQTASGSQPGLLAAADWTTFNNKQPSGNYITGLTGDITASGPGNVNATLTNSSVTGQVLTGYSVGAAVPILATDTILEAFENLQAQVNSSPVASTGDINQMSFIAADNQSSPADITGFAFSNSSVRSFDALVSVTRNNTYAVYDINGVQNATGWYCGASFTGDTTGIIFSISNSGQVQYTSTSTGFTAKIAFRAQVTNI